MFYSVQQRKMSTDQKSIKNIGLRLSESEVARLDAVVARVKKRNPYMDQTKVLKEVIGFEPRTFVSDEDIEILRGKRSIGDLDSEAGLSGVSGQQQAESSEIKISPADREGLLAMLDEEYKNATEDGRRIIEQTREALLALNDVKRKPRKHKDS